MTKCMRAIIKCLGVEVGEVFKWDKDNADIERYNAGLVYKTKEEATAVAEKMLKNLSKKG